MLIEIRTLDTNTSKSKVRQTQTKPLQHVVEPNSRIEIYIDGQKQTGQPTPGTPGKKLSKVGKDLVISQEDETLLELVNFYDAADVTLVGEYWPITGTQLTSVPEGFAYQAAATQEVAALVPASSSILPWGLGALAAAGLGGGGGGGGTDNGGTSALNVISAYNGSNTTPTLTHYSTAGVLNVTGDRLDAINDAIALLSTEATNTSAKVQAVVNGYNAIIAAADGQHNNATNPTLAQYAAIGVTGVDTPQKAQLLGDVIDVKSYSDVDTVAKLQKLADGVAAVMMGAKGNTAPTLAELQALGINNATQDNLLAVQSAIAQTKDDGSEVDTLSELQNLVNAVIDALNVISAYDGSNTIPTLTHYSTAGVFNVPADTLDAINSAIALLSTEATNTSAKVQAVVNGYNAIIAAADGQESKDNNATNPTLAQYAAIGVTGVDTPQKAQLLGDVIDIKSYLGINTVAEIQALAATANKLMSLTEATKQNISQNELESFGMIDLTPDRFGVLLNKVKDNTANGGVNIDTLKELQDLVDITSPTFTTDASQVFRRDVVEKTSGSFYTVKANDSSGIKSYSLSNDDGRHFKIDPTTGALSFINTPDFENPLDGFTLPDEPRNTYYFTVYATDSAGNSSAQGMNVNVLSMVGVEKVLDLGNDPSGKWYGQLIKPVKVEGKWYYHWDRNGNNEVDRNDSVNNNVIEDLFIYDINGIDDLTRNNTTDTHRYVTLNGMKLAVPTANGTGDRNLTYSIDEKVPNKGTAYDLLDGNSKVLESQPYDDLLAIWDAYNGNLSDNTFNLAGIPPGWATKYWSASTRGLDKSRYDLSHAFIDFERGLSEQKYDFEGGFGKVIGPLPPLTDYIYAAFQVISA